MTGTRGKKVVLWSIVWFNLIALSLPTLIILGASFTSGNIVQFPPDGFSLKWYGKLWLLDDFKDAFMRTFYVSVICTIISIPAGTLAALAFARHRIRFRTTLQVYLLLPFTIPLVVSGLGMMMIFGEARILGQLWPVGFGLCIINLPFMIWAVSATVNALDDDLENAKIFVPLRALTITQNESFVFVINKTGEKQIVKKIIVKTGVLNGTEIEIINGLRFGDEIVVDGNKNIGDGEVILIK